MASSLKPFISLSLYIFLAHSDLSGTHGCATDIDGVCEGFEGILSQDCELGQSQC